MPKAEIIKRPIQEISSRLKKSVWAAVFESLATIILGVLLIAWPDQIIQIIAYIVGAFLIIKGIYQTINYFIIKGQNDFFNNILLVGVVSILLGIALLLIGEEIINVFRIIIGIWLIYESLVRINTAIKLHAVGIPAWKYVLILAILVLLIGIFVTFNSGAIVTLIGWMMILSGFISIVGDIMMIQYINKIADLLTKGSTKEN